MGARARHGIAISCLAIVLIVAFLLLRYREDPHGIGPSGDGEGGSDALAGRGGAPGGDPPETGPDGSAGRGPRGTLVIEVRDGKGVPVPGARVGLWRKGDTGLGHWDALSRAGAGPAGRANLPEPDGEPPFVLAIRPPGDRPDLVPLVVRGWRPGDPVPPVPRALTVSGTVVGPDRRPIPGANVHCRAEGYEGSGAICDEEGRFRIGGLGGGQVTLVALPETFGMTPAAGEAVVVGAGREEVRLVLRPDTDLTIRLFPWRSEWPVSAYLFTDQLPGGRGFRQITFRDGVARARGLRPHLRYSLLLRWPYFGFCPLSTGIPGDVRDASVELGPGLVIHGTLEFPGKPVRLTVAATHYHPFAGHFRSEGEIREDGTFRIRGLFPATFSLLARAVYADESEYLDCAEVEAGDTVDLRLLEREEFEAREMKKRREAEDRKRAEAR